MVKGTLELNDIEVLSKIGLYDEEKREPQTLLISVNLTYDFSAISESDNLEHGLDYVEFIDWIRDFCLETHRDTMEYLGSELIKNMKKKWSILHAKICIRKPKYENHLKIGAVKIHVEG
jgi:dihydroneopterin aldolase